MVDSTKKGVDYPMFNTNNPDKNLNRDDKKQTQTYPTGPSKNQGNVYGGKIQQREQDVRDISDDQISGASAWNNEKQLNAVKGKPPIK